MKYSHRSNYRKTCPHDPDTRTQLGSRLRYARIKLGWSVEQAGKYFQVTDRTWHNWETGAHRIPFAVYKLSRILARLELPGEAWAGWRIEGDQLITPENRIITPKDGAWWSLLIRQAASFRTAYAEANRLRMKLDEITGLPRAGEASPEGPRLRGGAELSAAKLPPVLVTRGETPIKRHQNDVIMQSWPIPSDSPTPLTLLHAPRPITSASASTPSSALLWMPSCALRSSNLLRPDQSLKRSILSQLKKAAQASSCRPFEPVAASRLTQSPRLAALKRRQSMTAKRQSESVASDTKRVAL
jgi:transcriptional regulator with XRE-family HTH domain